MPDQEHKPGLGTLALHAGQEPDSATTAFNPLSHLLIEIGGLCYAQEVHRIEPKRFLGVVTAMENAALCVLRFEEAIRQ